MICKSTNSQTRGFESCGKDIFKRYKFGLCTKCFFDWTQEDERGKIYYAKSFKPKVKKVILKANKLESKEKKESQINWRVKLQTNLQFIARLIDKDLPCLARKTTGQMHGGHVFAKGGNSTMALNLHNIHRQSAYSNKHLNDDGKLREELVIEYGNDYFEFIKTIKYHKSLEHSNKDYQEIYFLSLEISNMLKKKESTYEVEERINLRSKINLTLGIYDKEYCEFKINI
jgi:hypothetical protein